MATWRSVEPALVKELAKNRAQERLIKTELETVAKKSYFPRFWAKEVR